MNNFRLDDQGRIIPVGNLRGIISTGGLVPGVPIWTGEASGNPAYFEDGSLNDLISIKLAVLPKQSGTGTPSPTNPRYMIPWETIDVNVKNDTVDPTISNDYTAQLGGEYYGGVFDPILGKGILTYKTIDLGSRSWTPTTVAIDYVGFYNSLGDKSTDISMPVYCSHYEAVNVSRSLVENNQIGLFNTGSSANRCIIHDDNFANYTPEQVKEALNGVEYSYYLDEPIEVEIPQGQNIESINGKNYISTNGENIDNLIYIRNWDIALNILWNAVFS